ncbi:HlyD family efflux transporter periplasmic adaptor subunit [Alcaligenaceae bacterium CGII-47]|nr:HlyD family efflux transporter periplasmic adaptor subunit [Alcaligenaceae bacterium CGII-47]
MTVPAPASTSTRKRLLLATTVVFILIGILYAVWWFLYAAHYESTDDAYVHGNLVQVTSQIPGTVIAIGADDTQRVEQGSTLVTLDNSDTFITLEQAKAALAQAVRHTRTLFVQNDALAADVDMSQANIEQAQTVLNKAESDLKRRNALQSSGGVSGEEILHAQIALKAAQAGLTQARAAHAASQAKLLTNQVLTSGTSIAHHPDVRQAADQVRNAWLSELRTHILAPVNGMVAQRTVQLGQRINPGAPLMTIIPLDKLWVEANFKENQIQHIEAGQTATLVSDMYGNAVTYHGTVIGITAGTGGAFALLPAQNASGNWIKVIQRVPVRIALDPQELADHPLRVGLSMQVKIDLSSPSNDASLTTVTNLSTQTYAHQPAEVDQLIARIIQDNLGS